MGRQYCIYIYTSRNTSRVHRNEYRNLQSARQEARRLCCENLFPTEDFHGNPLTKGKVAIEGGELNQFPKYCEIWEYEQGIDKTPIKTQWTQ